MQNRTRVKTTPEGPMAALLAQEGAVSFSKIGELVTGSVLSVGKSELVVDIGGLYTGIIRGPELRDELGESSGLKVGDPIEATVLDIDNELGMLELSLRSAAHQRAWGILYDAKREGKNIEVEVTGANKGGLIIRLNNIYGFLPVSQLARTNYPNVEGNKNLIFEHLQGFVKKKLMVKVIDVDERDTKLIVSEKEAALDLKVSQNFPYQVGDRVDGVIRGVTDFGVFIEFGDGYEGLIHVSEISSAPGLSLRDQFHMNAPMTAEIVSIQRGRVALSLKRMALSPVMGT